MEQLVGREHEKMLLDRAFKSPEAELVAIFGRRRVGKTFLVRSVYEGKMLFEFSGVHHASLAEQLLSFSLALKNVAGDKTSDAKLTSWIEAFHLLARYLTPKLKNKRGVVFLDELPWLQTPKSGFLGAFEHFWNSWASRQPNLVVVICGSAASWMIQKIVNNRGGLHNRITQKIRLMPFDLNETEEYLKSLKVNIDRYQVLQLYMAMGGIPQYLKSVRTGESATQAIDRICFAKDGVLKDEFNNIFTSLFDNAEQHIAIIKALSVTRKGLNRTEIILSCGLSSGGTATKLLEELVESGFITPYIPFDRSVKESIYKLSDEYSLFYLKFMQKSRFTGDGTWLKLSTGPSWSSWSGIAFEGICQKHVQQIKKALGIAGVLTTESVWRYASKGEEQGTQIDLLIDRTDHCINICEMKYTLSSFSIDKRYAAELKNKLAVFREKAKTNKALFLTMITTYGIRQNIYYTGLVQNEITMDALFDK